MSNLPTTLPDWLAFLEARQSERVINLGLERVHTVKAALDLSFSCPVIVVGGTNGKGSACAMLESILLEAGYRVGLYIKPHFLPLTNAPKSTVNRPAMPIWSPRLLR